MEKNRKDEAKERIQDELIKSNTRGVVWVKLKLLRSSLDWWEEKLNSTNRDIRYQHIIFRSHWEQQEVLNQLHLNMF